ncbi:MAG: GNAT family N-acetyltransferase [Pseudobutyrivibrio sp.]|nr:GNAT family N-acetyltransferase [Pseudobutyrivibrio sp.]
MTEIECSEDYSTIKDLFVEYSGIKGAEGCFVSFDKELADLKNFYSGGAILLGYEDDAPFGCIAIKKVDDNTCEAKRLYIKPEFRGKGYARIMLNSMIAQARELGYKEVCFTTRPDVMGVAYKLYKRMGFEELGCDKGVVSMRINL